MSKIQANNKPPPWALSLQDPDDPENDLGRKTYLWREIQETFKVFDDHLHRTSQGENIMARTQKDAPDLIFLFGYNLGRYRDRRNIFKAWLKGEGSRYDTEPKGVPSPDSPQHDNEGRKLLSKERAKALEMYFGGQQQRTER